MCGDPQNMVVSCELIQGIGNSFELQVWGLEFISHT